MFNIILGVFIALNLYTFEIMYVYIRSKKKKLKNLGKK